EIPRQRREKEEDVGPGVDHGTAARTLGWRGRRGRRRRRRTPRGPSLSPRPSPWPSSSLCSCCPRPCPPSAAAAGATTVDADRFKNRGRRKKSVVGFSAESGPAEPGGRGSFLASRAVVPLCVLPRRRVLRYRGLGRGAQVRRHVEVLRA
ncbi:unnamed protein product, partial [Laminaria digitata]